MPACRPYFELLTREIASLTEENLLISTIGANTSWQETFANGSTFNSTVGVRMLFNLVPPVANVAPALTASSIQLKDLSTSLELINADKSVSGSSGLPSFKLF